MLNTPIAALESLKDLNGVIGSFVVASSGDVVESDLPSYFEGATSELGPRISRLQAALELTEGESAKCVLSYGSHKLVLRPFGEGFLAILTSADIQLPALRMAMNLVARKLESLGADHLSNPAESGTQAKQEGVPQMQPESAADAASSSSAVSSSSAPAAVPQAGSSSAPLPPSSATLRGGGAHAPESHAHPLSRKRAVYFRGKRVQ